MKDDKEKEFVCRRCLLFLDTEDLIDGKCPECESDEHIYTNED